MHVAIGAASSFSLFLLSGWQRRRHINIQQTFQRHCPRSTCIWGRPCSTTFLWRRRPEPNPDGIASTMTISGRGCQVMSASMGNLWFCQTWASYAGFYFLLLAIHDLLLQHEQRPPWTPVIQRGTTISILRDMLRFGWSRISVQFGVTCHGLRTTSSPRQRYRFDNTMMDATSNAT